MTKQSGLDRQSYPPRIETKGLRRKSNERGGGNSLRTSKTKPDAETAAAPPWRFGSERLPRTLAEEIIRIAGSFETRDSFAEFAEGGVKLGGTPGKFLFEGLAPPN